MVTVPASVATVNFLTIAKDTKKSPVVDTDATSSVSLNFGSEAPTSTANAPLVPTPTRIPVSIPDVPVIIKIPSPGVDTRITTSLVTGEISVPTSAGAETPTVDKSGSGDSSVAPAGHLAGIASVIAAPSGDAMVAPSHVSASLNAATDQNAAVAAPSEIAGANIPAPKAPSPVVDNSHALVAVAPLTTLTVPPAGESSYVAEAAALTYNGQKISVNPSEFIAPSATIAITAPSQVVVYQGESFTVEPSRVVAPETTVPIAIATTPPRLSAVTVGSITLSIGPSAAMIGSSTYLLSPGEPPITTVLDGQTIRIGAEGIGFASTTVAIPTGQAVPTLSTVVADGLKIDVGSDKAIVNGITYAIGNGATPQTVVIGTETLSFGPGGVGLPSTTILPFYPPTVASPVVVDGLTFSIDATRAVISGTTYAIGPGSAPKTLVIGTETVSLGPGGVGLPLTTLVPPSLPSITPTPVTADGLAFSIEPTDVIIGGTRYAIGSGAPTNTLTISGETIVIGPGGVALRSTTVPPPGLPLITPTPVTADGLTFSIEPTDVIIGGTRYAIGSGAPTETLVVSGETIVIGPGGVALRSTTVPPPGLPLITPTPVTADGLTFSIEPTDVIIGGTRYAIGSGAPTETLVVSGETIVIGPGGVKLPSTTITPPGLLSNHPTPVTADGLTFSIEPTDVIIGGTRYAIGSGAPTETLIISGETVIIGPGGVKLPSTTIKPPGYAPVTPTPVTADSLVFSIEPTDVVIGGTTYAIGSGAPTETLTISGETVVIGPGGVALPSTTIAPPASASTGLDVFTGVASISRPILSLIGSVLCFCLGVFIL